MVETHESVEYLLTNGQDLLQNTNTPEAEKNKLRKDIANLVEQWESLSNTVNNRMQRYYDICLTNVVIVGCAVKSTQKHSSPIA